MMSEEETEDDVRNGVPPVTSIKVGDSFSTWDEFEKTLKAFSNESNTVYVIKNSKLVETVNLGLKKKKYNAALRYKSAFIVCKNYGDYKTKSVGLRPNQQTFKIGCESNICIKANLDRQVLIVESANFEHNHITDKEVTDFYPEVRSLDSNELGDAQKLLKLRVKPSLLLASILEETGKHLVGQDLVNARHALKQKERNGKSETEDLLLYLESLEKLGDHIVVGTDDNGVIQYIFIMHQNMIKTYKKFPEVLIADSTYNTNKNKLPLFLISAVNGLGGSECIAYAFIINETKDMYGEIFNELKKAVGEDTMKQTKTIIVDRDMSEISSVNTVAPHVSVHLCSFHVSCSFKRNTTKEENKDSVREILQAMIYAKDDEKYADLYDSLKVVASSKFIEYFDKYWDNCQSAWSRRHKTNTPSLGNDTTNRNESMNQKIKAVIDRHTELKEAIIQIRAYINNKLNTMAYRRYLMCAKRSYVVNSNDEDIQNILDTCTQFAATHLRAEVEAAKLPAVKLIYKTSMKGCNCYIAKSLLLSCRHIMRLRAAEGLPRFSKDLVAQRWLKSYNMPEESVADEVNSAGNMIVQKMPPVLRPKGKQEKFKSGVQLGGELAELLSVCGTTEYERKVSLLKEIIFCWKTGQEVALCRKGPAPEREDLQEEENTDTAQGPTPREDLEEVNAVPLSSPDLAASSVTTDSAQGPTPREDLEEVNGVPLPSPDLAASSVTTDSAQGKRFHSGAKLPTVLSCKGRPKENGKMYTAIGTKRKTLENLDGAENVSHSSLMPTLTLPPAVKIIGKPRECDKTVFRFQSPKQKLIPKESQTSKESSSKSGITDKKKKYHETDSESGEELDIKPIIHWEKAIGTVEINLVSDSESDGIPETEATCQADLSHLFDDDNDRIMMNLVGGAEQDSVVGAKQDSLDTPLCFCCPKKHTARRIAGPRAKQPGRHYYVCPTKECKFWRYVSTPKKELSNTVQRMFPKIKLQAGKSQPEFSETVQVVTAPLTRMRLNGEKEVAKHKAIVEPDPTACSTCKMGEPSHACITCKRKVHAIPPCSEAPPGERQEEGYGKGRICKACYVVPQSKRVNSKRTALEDIDAIDVDDADVIPSSQTTRSGRVVVKKRMFTPTK